MSIDRRKQAEDGYRSIVLSHRGGFDSFLQGVLWADENPSNYQSFLQARFNTPVSLLGGLSVLEYVKSQGSEGETAAWRDVASMWLKE